MLSLLESLMSNLCFPVCVFDVLQVLMNSTQNSVFASIGHSRGLPVFM